MKKIIVLCILFLCVAGVCFGQTNQTRSLTVTTYYPSPNAVYANIRLSPTNTAPSGSALQPGIIYYNITSDKIVYHNKTLAPIELPGSGGGGSYWVYNGTPYALNNTNPDGSVNIGEYSAGGEVLEVNGELWAYAKPPGFTGNTWVDIVRNNTNNRAALIFDTYPTSADAARIWLTGNPGVLVIDNNTNTFPWMTVSGSGKVGIGRMPDPSCNLIVRGKTGVDNISQAVMMTEGNGKQEHFITTASNTSRYGPEFRAYRSRGSLGSSLSALKKDDTIFQFNGYGWNGAEYKRGAFIQFSADGDFTSTSTPGKISFFTTAMKSTVPQERMVITSDGNVGINNSSPQYKLVVRIDAAQYAFINSTGGWQFSSDKRLKKNISGIEESLAKVLSIKGIRYDPRHDTSSVPQKGKAFGFVAQDLETVLPELVTTDRHGRKAVAYGGITPVLVEAIKAQHEEIEALRKEIQALKDWK